MIYTLEKRCEFGGGSVTSHWEVWCYTHRTAIGALAGGRSLKKGTRAQCQAYVRKKGIKLY